MTTPPDFGGHEIEEGLLEDLGGPAEDRAVSHHDGALPDDLRWLHRHVQDRSPLDERAGVVNQDVNLA